MKPIFNHYQPIGSVDSLEPEAFLPEPDLTLNPQTVVNQMVPISLVVGLILAILLGRLFYLQVVKGARHFFLAEGNRIRQLVIPAPRGIIYDRAGQPLVKNIAQYSLVAIPADLPKSELDRQAMIDRFAAQIRPDYQTIFQKTLLNRTDRSVEPVEIIADLTHPEAIDWQIKLNDVVGLTVTKQPKRHYEALAGLGHIVGYIGKVDDQTLKSRPDYLLTDRVGKAGLELIYEPTLRGTHGARQFEVNAKGNLERPLAQIKPQQGQNLRLSLDRGLQATVASALTTRLPKPHLKAVAIAIEPSTGAVLAMLSYPDFDSNVITSGHKSEIDQIFSDPNQPMVNRAIAGQYPAGSTIKPLWAAAALEEKIVKPGLAFDTPTEISIGDFHFPDWKDHGVTDIRRAIAESNNIFFYAIAGGWGPIKGLGIQKMEKYLRLFGVGEKTGLDLPGELVGLVPSPAGKQKKTGERWYIGDSYHLGIGQGDLAITPLQLLVAQATIFNGGKIVKPYLVEATINQAGQETKSEPKVMRQIPVEDRWLEIVKEGLRMTVTEGSGRTLADVRDKEGKIVEIAGKTGTAQLGSGSKTHAWFTGFAPWQNPAIGLIVLVEEGGEGHAVAAPVAKAMFEYWFNK